MSIELYPFSDWLYAYYNKKIEFLSKNEYLQKIKEYDKYIKQKFDEDVNMKIIDK